MQIENTIKINAPQSIVWDVTKAIEQWPNWTPTVTAVERTDDGPLKPGSKVWIKQPGQPKAEWTVTKYLPGECFTWESRRLGLKFIASHTLVTDGNSTINILKVEATGIVSIVLLPLLKLAIGRALAEENKGLKIKCEDIYKAQSNI